MERTFQLLQEAKKIVERGLTIDVSAGDFSVKLVTIDGERFALKKYGNILPDMSLHRRALSFFERNVTGLRTRLRYPDVRATNGSRLSLEVCVLRNWEAAGIVCPQVISTDEENILLSFVEGKNYEQLIRDGEYSSSAHYALLETIKTIQQVANKQKNPCLLHNDMHIVNFMYADGVATAIDPGLLFKTELSFRELRANFNTLMALSFTSPYFGCDEDTAATYDNLLHGFVQVLDDESLYDVSRDLTPLNQGELMYYRCAKKLGLRGNNPDFAETFSRANMEYLQTVVANELHHR